MSGLAVIRALMIAHTPLTTVVPVARIMADDLPVGTVIPAIGLSQISSVRQLTVSMGESTTMVTERVQATAIAKKSAQGGTDYAGLVTLMRLMRQACPHTHGTVAGITVLSVAPDIEGPDLPDAEAGRISRSQDFIVRWLENR